MTLGEMLSSVYEDCGHPASPATVVTTRITKNLNNAYRMILGDPALRGLRDSLRESAFSSASGQWNYVMPEHLSRVTAITERDNDRRLEPITLDYIRTHDPGMTASGSPWAFVNKGRRPTQFPVADVMSGLWAVSSSALDTTQVVEINAVRAGGTMTGDVAVTLTGTTRAQFAPGVTDFQEIQTLRLSAACVGNVTLYDAAVDGNALAIISAGKLSSNYLIIQLYPTPSSVIAYFVDGEMKPVTMDDTQDIPVLPEEFHDLIPLRAKAYEYEMQRRDVEYAQAMRDFTKRFDDLKYRMNVQHGQVLEMGSMGRRGISRMGGMFPVDTVL